ncbi:transposable element Tcb1 transposase [Trichonephila clavipes]|nr:transposable element Tcb1 transposase [Trichonephila clavipes]
MAQRKHLDDFLRGRIIGRLECGRTQLEVSEELGIAQSVISRLWQRFQDDVILHETSHPGLIFQQDNSRSNTTRKYLDYFRIADILPLVSNLSLSGVTKNIRPPSTCKVRVWAPTMRGDLIVLLAWLKYKDPRFPGVVPRQHFANANPD